MRYHIKLLNHDEFGPLWLKKEENNISHWTDVMSEALDVTQGQVPELFIRLNSRISLDEKLVIVRKELSNREKHELLLEGIKKAWDISVNAANSYDLTLRAIIDTIDRINRNAI